MTEHDDVEQASGLCARACGALARVRRAYLWCAQRACATSLPQGGEKARISARGQRDVAVCLTNSDASAFVDTDHVRSSPLGAHCQGGRTLYTPLTISVPASNNKNQWYNILVTFMFKLNSGQYETKI